MSIDPIVEDEKKVFSNDTVEIVLYKSENEHYLKISANGWSTEINNYNCVDGPQEIMEFCVRMGIEEPKYHITHEKKVNKIWDKIDQQGDLIRLKNELNNPTQYKEIKNQFKQNLYNLLN